MSISSKLSRFARSREKALLIAKRLDSGRARAITKIKTIAGYISGYDPMRQLRYVSQVESEIILLLPAEESRFAKLRAEMLELLDRAKS